MQTPYGALSYQHQETGNHSEHSFVHCYWLYTRHKHSRPSRQNQCPTNGHPSQTPYYPFLTNDSNTNTSFTLP